MKFLSKSGERFSIEVPNWFFFIAFIPIAVLAVLLVIFLKAEGPETHFRSTIIHLKFQGILTHKFTDSRNRGTPTFKFRASNRLTYGLGADDWIGLWNEAQIGDSIYKQAADSFLYLKKFGRPDTLFRFRYNFNQGGYTITQEFSDNR